MENIVFTNISSDKSIEAPKPASMFLPDWYKKTESYINGAKVPTSQGTMATIKRCMPVFDAITAGYIITLPVDVYVKQIDCKPHYTWSSREYPVEFHPIAQAPLHPAKKESDYSKWTNPWGIKTPKGYSVLFTQPMHQDLPFTILPGIVDTDEYTVPVNFPFVLNDKNFAGLIPCGTPIAQVIPFKREQWEMKIGTQKDLDEQLNLINKMSHYFYDKYKNLFRSDKNYK